MGGTVKFDQSQKINSQTMEKLKHAHCPPTSQKPAGWLRGIKIVVVSLIILEVITADFFCKPLLVIMEVAAPPCKNSLLNHFWYNN